MKHIETLEKIVSDIDNKLDDKDTVRELALKSSRAVRRLARKIIQSIHRGENPQNTLQEALEEVSKVKSIVEGHDELYHSGFLRNGFQELAEAHILWCISQDKEPKPPEEMDLTPSSYLLGLADVVGELRRMILNKLDNGDIEKAKELLEKMERIKDMILEFDYPKAIVPLRNKQDIARNLVEKTRGDLINSIQNEKLMNKMDEFIENLEENE
ncbi:MAG: translin family protein [Thermoplasmatota archaeon]